MEKNKNDMGEAGEDMARSEQSPPDTVSVSTEKLEEEVLRALMPPPAVPPLKQKPVQQEEQVEQVDIPQRMVTLKPKFLPNLKALMFPKMVYEQPKRLVITPLLTYPHDPVAALKLRGVRCASFDLPKDMFPRGAPIWKITFLPEEMLPMGFDAGGVFNTGVLARKYYPTDLLSPDHKGQTPPLFIGHRNSNYILPKELPAQFKGKCNNCKGTGNANANANGNGNGNGKGNGNGNGKRGKGKGKGKGQIQQAPPPRIQPLTPAPPPAPALVRSILKPSAAVGTQMNRLLVTHNISVLEVVIMPNFRKPPTRYPSAVPMQMQYNMYAPDMSRVIFSVQDIGLLVVAIVSTIHHPNVPEVALSTMDNEHIPKFELPAAVFPADPNRLGPRFLPLRYLPDFCDAGCVFPPGSLPDSVFQGALRKHYDLGQHHYSMTPPLFVGRRKPQPEPEDSDDEEVPIYNTGSVSTQLKKLALKNMAAVKQNINSSVPLPESTKRTNDFKLSVAAGKPKGFVLIESDHVPRGATPTDFFGAFLMGCFFKITPHTSCLYAFSSEEDEEDDEEQDTRGAKEQPETGLTEAAETETEETEAPKADVGNTEAEKAEVKELDTNEAEVGEFEDLEPIVTDEAEVEVEVNSEDYETEEYIAEEYESEDYVAEEVEYSEYVTSKGETEETDSEQTDGDKAYESDQSEDDQAYESEETDSDKAYESEQEEEDDEPYESDQEEGDEPYELDQEGGDKPNDSKQEEGDEPDDSEQEEGDKPNDSEQEEGDEPYDSDQTEEYKPKDSDQEEGEKAYESDQTEEYKPNDSVQEEGEKPYGSDQEEGDEPYESDQEGGDKPNDSKQEEGDEPDDSEQEEGDKPNDSEQEEGDEPYDSDQTEEYKPKDSDQEEGEEPYESEQTEDDKPNDSEQTEDDKPNDSEEEGDKPNESEQEEGHKFLVPEAVVSKSKSKKVDFTFQQPVAKKSNLNDTHPENVVECPGCMKVYSYFTVDSNLDDIADAAGNLDTARFEVIVHPSELPGMNVDRAVEQFRQVLKVRNEIRSRMTGAINAHIAKMEADNVLTLATNIETEMPKRAIRKPCSHCGKTH